MKQLLTFVFVCFPIIPCIGTPPAPTHNFIIIMDYGQSEERLRTQESTVQFYGCSMTGLARLGAMTSTLVPALYQQAAPILVSRSLLYTLLYRKQVFKDCLTKDIGQLVRLYDGKKITKAPSLALFKQHCQYADKMYEKIKQELDTLCKQGTLSEAATAVTTLTAKHPYLEISAPRTLHVYKDDAKPITKELHHELQAYALCYYTPLESNYLIKEVSDGLALLIPRHMTHNTSTSYSAHPAITPLEKELGIKVNHLKDITVEELRKPVPLTYDEKPATHLQRIFLTKEEGATQIWTLYMAGHGLPSFPERSTIKQLQTLDQYYLRQQKASANATSKHRHMLITHEIARVTRELANLPATDEKVICSMSTEEFKKVLLFLKHHVNTSLLLYTSCFGGGEHTVTPYQGDTNILPYDCIVGSLSDTVSYQGVPMLLLPPYRTVTEQSTMVIDGLHDNGIDPKQKCLIPFTSINFGQFFKKAQATKRDTSTLIQCLHPYTKDDNTTIRRLENIPLERPAGSTRFSPIHNNHTISTASSVALGTTVEVALLDQSYYGSLKIPHKVPSFISIKEGSAYHVIESLNAPGQYLKDLAKSFLQLPSLSTSKVFWIKKVTCARKTPPPFVLPREFFMPLLGGKADTLTELHDVIILRNISTAETIKENAAIGIYFSDSRENTWFLPIKQAWQIPRKVPKSLAHAELYALFNGLYEATH